MPIAKNEDGLATIVGHEIAHYTLRHLAEKASISQFFSIIGLFASWMLGLPLDSIYQVQLLLLDLPNSRACETEGCILVCFPDRSRLCGVIVHGQSNIIASDLD